MDIKLIDGVPHWSARGADSFSPFNSGNECVYVIGYLGISGSNACYYLTRANIDGTCGGKGLVYSTSTQTYSDDYLSLTLASHTLNITFNKKCILKTNNGTGTETEYEANSTCTIDPAYPNCSLMIIFK